MLGSLSSMERWSVTKHIQCFLLMSHDCLPTLFWIYKLKGQSCKHPLHYSLMPSFSSMPIFGVSKMLLNLLDVTKTVWSAPSGVPSVRRLEGPLYWVFLSALCLTSVDFLYVLYDILGSGLLSLAQTCWKLGLLVCL